MDNLSEDSVITSLVDWFNDDIRQRLHRGPRRRWCQRYQGGTGGWEGEGGGGGGANEESGLVSHSVGLVNKISYVSVCTQPALFNSLLLK